MNENMVWTDSQYYEADEILSHPFTLTPPVQRAACALYFEGSLQESTKIIQLTNHPPTLFNLSHFSEGCVPRFFLTALYGEEQKPWQKYRGHQLMRIWFGLIPTHIHKIALTYIIPFISPKLSLFSGFIPD